MLAYQEGRSNQWVVLAVFLKIRCSVDFFLQPYVGFIDLGQNFMILEKSFLPLGPPLCREIHIESNMSQMPPFFSKTMSYTNSSECIRNWWDLSILSGRKIHHVPIIMARCGSLFDIHVNSEPLMIDLAKS